MKNEWIGRVLGRVSEDLDTTLDAPPSAPVAEPEQPRQSRATYDEESGNTPVEEIPSETVVNELLAAWNNGQQNEVAAQLLFTPVSYADFVKLCFAVGQDSAVQLGLMLDDLAESEGMVTNEPDQNRILGSGQPKPQRKLAGGPPEAGPAGGEAQVPQNTAQAADRALPPPPLEEPEPQEPTERNE